MGVFKGNNVEDKLLLRGMQEDNMDAFDILYDKYWEMVYNSALKRLSDPDYAKDITQDIFMQLWTRRKDLEIDNLSAYLFTAVRNNVLKWMQKEQKYIPVPALLHEFEAARDQADAPVLLKEFMAAYTALLKTLTPSQQRIFEMRFNENLSTAVIAAELNISRKTVQNQLGRSITQLRESLFLLCILIFL